MRLLASLLLTLLLLPAAAAHATAAPADSPTMAAAAGQTPSGASYVATTWVASVTTGVTYNVYRAITNNGACPTTGTKIASSLTLTSYNDLTVTPGAYCYWSTATANGAESNPSNTASVMVLPQPPTGMVATAH